MGRIIRCLFARRDKSLTESVNVIHISLEVLTAPIRNQYDSMSLVSPARLNELHAPSETVRTNPIPHNLHRMHFSLGRAARPGAWTLKNFRPAIQTIRSAQSAVPNDTLEASGRN